MRLAKIVILLFGVGKRNNVRSLSGDDTLENAHIMGEQMNEDEENPKEIDIARDVDEAEEDLRRSLKFVMVFEFLFFSSLSSVFF